MQPVYLSIQQKATGERIRELLKKNGYTVKDIQKFMGFENPQAIYKWISGRSLPHKMEASMKIQIMEPV